MTWISAKQQRHPRDREMEGLGVKEVGEGIKNTDDAMKDDIKGDLKQKPVGNASKQQVWEDITGSSP